MFDYCTNQEATIAKALVSKMLAKGYTVSVYDGEEFPIRQSTDERAICEAMNSTSDDRLYFHEAGSGQRLGWVWLIWGNGEDLISDCSDNALTAELVDSD